MAGRRSPAVADQAVEVAMMGVAFATPVAKTVLAIAPIPGLELAGALVEKIFTVMEQMRYNKKQSRRLAESARDVVDAVEEALTGATPEELDPATIENINKLVRTLQRVEEQLREIATLNFVKRLLQYLSIQEDLVDLDRECQEAANLFMIKLAIDSRRHQMQSEKARRDDMKALMDEVRRINEDQDKIAERIGLRGMKVDSESTNGLQMLLHRIDNDPENIAPEVRTFAETATKTIKSRTNVDVPRTLPWFVKLKEIKRGEKIGSGGFSFVYKGYWVTRQMDVAIKVFRERESINELIDEIVIWKAFNHPYLHSFLGAAPLEQPAFVISPYYKNGNALDYLKNNPGADRGRILHHVSLGMAYLHSQSIVHGDLKARNVLIDDDGNALVADFGLAKFQRWDFITPIFVPGSASPGPAQSVDSRKVPLVGTLHWLAPECFEDGTVSTHTDVWAMGMLAYELYTDGLIPLAEINDDELGQKLHDGVRPHRPENPAIPDHAWTLMDECWKQLPLERPSFPDLTLVLGLFQDSGLASLQEASGLFVQQGAIISPAVGKWPGVASRLVSILTLTLQTGPIESVSASSTRFSSLSEQAEEQVISALRVLDMVAKSAVYTESLRQVIVDAGVLPPLLFILRQKSAIHTEILNLGCEIISSLAAEYYTVSDTVRTAMVEGDFINVLVELVGYAEQKTSLKALNAIQRLVKGSEFTYGVPSDELLEPKRRAIRVGVIPRLITVFGGDDIEGICEACEFVGLLGRYPTALAEAQVNELTPILVSLVLGEREIKVRQHAIKALSTLTSSSSEQAHLMRETGCFSKLLPIWDNPGEESESLEIGWPGYVPSYLAGDIMIGLATSDDVSVLLKLLQGEGPSKVKIAAAESLMAIGRRANKEERMKVAQEQGVFLALLPFLSSEHKELATLSGEALTMFSTAKDSLSLGALLESARSASGRTVVTKIISNLLEGANEEDKITISTSGILPILRTILDIVMKPGFNEISDKVPPSATSGTPPSSSNDIYGSSNTNRSCDVSERGAGLSLEDSAAEVKETETKTSLPLTAAPNKPELDANDEALRSVVLALDHMITLVSTTALETISKAYVEAGIHLSLADFLSETPPDPFTGPQYNCLWVLRSLAHGDDGVKLALVGTSLLSKVRRILDVESGVSFAMQWSCGIIEGLLTSEDDGDEVTAAVLQADLVGSLVKFMSHPDNEKSAAAQALSYLILSFGDETSPESQDAALNVLAKYCAKGPDETNNVFGMKTYMIVDYLQHRGTSVRKFGLDLTSSLLKGSVSQRKSILNTSGLRSAVEGCANSEEPELRDAAKGLLERLKARKR